MEARRPPLPPRKKRKTGRFSPSAGRVVRRVKTMFKHFKKLRPGVLITHVLITLGYPAVKASAAASSRLLVFTNALTVIGLILVILGVVYSMILHGDFDISSYYLQRGVRSLRRLFSRHAEEWSAQKSMADFLQDAREKREASFNYPLFLGLVYVLVSVVLAYGFLS